MECPVCGKFYFSKLFDEEIEAGETPNTTQCSMCGWYYDLEQLADPDLEHQANEMSLNQYKEWYKGKIKKNRRWEYRIENMPGPRPHICPVCGEYTFVDMHSYDICPICDWEDTGFEIFPDEQPGISMMSLNDHKKWFEEQRKQDPKFRAHPEIKIRKKKGTD